ncbi:MAG: insulinase family protein, partial [Proteobacteria bacterium]
FSTFSTVEQLDFAIDRLKLLMTQPDFPPAEFAKLKAQSQQGLRGALSDPGSVADIELDKLIYGERHPLGKSATPQTLAGITLDDVKDYYRTTYRPENAILVFAGAIDAQRANALAEKLLDGWQAGTPPQAVYNEGEARTRRITLVDNPGGQQAVVRMGTRAYTLKEEDRFAGQVFGQVLSSGIDSRLNYVLRAQKGLTYGAYGYFRPGRNGGAFELSVETKPESVDDAITSTFGVLKEMKENDITDAELNIAKQRTAGLMVLETQTIQDQAKRRTDTILNGYPVDYYDNYAKRIGQVTKAQVRDVANKYLVDDRVDIVVVGPAEIVRPQLEKFGPVDVIPMPLATTQPTR